MRSCDATCQKWNRIHRDYSGWKSEAVDKCRIGINYLMPDGKGVNYLAPASAYVAKNLEIEVSQALKM